MTKYRLSCPGLKYHIWANVELGFEFAKTMEEMNAKHFPQVPVILFNSIEDILIFKLKHSG